MRAISILYALFFFSITTNAQIEDKTIYDLTLAIDALDYTPQKRLEGFQGKELKKALYSIIDDSLLKQLNIDGWYLCSQDKRKGYEVWNLYYDRIDWETYAKYCKEINILLEIDGLIPQPK
ncbi:MAG: hypothetical protein H2058_06390 [Muricauda sp.]|nr:hypothetical protein [Allomuricauda sp.]MBA4744867.1 hypothetical protein [Allomuricauda sp.]